MTVNDEGVSELNYTWKFKQGSGPLVEIYPDDTRYETGTYRVLLVNRDEDEDEFTY